jgi:hypothetical protein
MSPLIPLINKLSTILVKTGKVNSVCAFLMWMSPGNSSGRGNLSKNICTTPTTIITPPTERYILPTTSFMIAVIFGSALFATAMTSSSVIGFRVSGKHSSVMIDTPNTFIPM